MCFSFSSLLTCWKILVKKTVPIPSRYRGRSWKVDHKTRSTTGGTKGTNQELVDTRVRFTLLELVHEESHKIVKRSQKRRKIGDNELRSQMCCLVVKLLHSLFTCLFTCLFICLFVTLKLCFNIQSWCLHDYINCTQYYVQVESQWYTCLICSATLLTIFLPASSVRSLRYRTFTLKCHSANKQNVTATNTTRMHWR